jgi:hypothetical protein
VFPAPYARAGRPAIRAAKPPQLAGGAGLAGLVMTRAGLRAWRGRARNHILSLERLGYQVTIQAPNPGTGESLATAG